MASRAVHGKRGKLKRRGDPYLDRRSGEDRRKVYSLDYFLRGNPDRRVRGERRTNRERRSDCIRINEWASICPDHRELSDGNPYIIDLRKLPRMKKSSKNSS